LTNQVTNLSKGFLQIGLQKLTAMAAGPKHADSGVSRMDRVRLFLTDRCTVKHDRQTKKQEEPHVHSLSPIKEAR
jgi:hypothetical protein